MVVIWSQDSIFWEFVARKNESSYERVQKISDLRVFFGVLCWMAGTEISSPSVLWKVAVLV